MSEYTKEEIVEIKKKASAAYAAFMDVILPGWEEDHNSVGTPDRVARMFVDELYAGIYKPMPRMTVFDNANSEGDGYTGQVFQGNIEVKSQCSHHHMPFFGVAHVAYIPDEGGKIIGLSKLNRIVEHFSRKPQVQENLTTEIHEYITKLIGSNKGVAVTVEAVHTCVAHRGIRQASTMKTAKLSGLYFTNEIGTRDEFYNMVRDLKK